MSNPLPAVSLFHNIQAYSFPQVTSRPALSLSLTTPTASNLCAASKYAMILPSMLAAHRHSVSSGIYFYPCPRQPLGLCAASICLQAWRRYTSPRFCSVWKITLIVLHAYELHSSTLDWPNQTPGLGETCCPSRHRPQV